jgi:hypothetical protein
MPQENNNNSNNNNNENDNYVMLCLLVSLICIGFLVYEHFRINELIRVVRTLTMD